MAGPAPPGDDAPNIVVILLDDTGFSHFGCYGSDLTTPNIDALAAGGLRYSNFHVTPLCSPTRAALLTGRNHHTVGMRAISNFDSGYPHMRGHITNHATTMAEVLRDTGYATFAVGKWHLCPMEDASAAGPYDQWPLPAGLRPLLRIPRRGRPISSRPIWSTTTTASSRPPPPRRATT